MRILLNHGSKKQKKTNIFRIVGLLSLFLLEGTRANYQARASYRSIANAQIAQIPVPRIVPRPIPSPFPQPRPLPELPPADELLKPSPPTTPVPEIAPGDDSVTLFVEGFTVVGSTVFTAEELATVLQPFTKRSLTLTELLQARSAITQLYINAGYVTSGAFIPPQEPKDGIVTIQVIEGSVTEIQISGNRRLRPGYLQSRLGLGTKTPFNINRLVERLRLLKLNPLIENITAELSAGVQPGTSILTVQVTEADTFKIDLSADNYYQTTSVGTWERQIELKEANLLGFGDGLNISYINSEGSNQVIADYTIPINPHDGTLNFNYQFASNWVVEAPFDELGINTEANYLNLTYRQPIIQTLTEELALSLIGSYETSRSVFLENILGEPIPFPTVGADANGRITVTALRFAQDWTIRGNNELFFLRSQFNVGLDLFNSTINATPPDGRFFSWQGQFQWVKLLAEDTLFLLRGQAQLASDALLPMEQIGIGGWSTVRGYPYQFALTDNGVIANAELRLPIYRNVGIDGLLSGIVFFDIGAGWNIEQENPDPSTLIGVGIGLQWQMGDRLQARIDWGIPLVSRPFKGDSLQDNGVYFSIRYSLF
jgi:hemolysin activation/secretion protein